jgi:uncharacterized membrane protein YphA (DoxX/SURF4 family)
MAAASARWHTAAPWLGLVIRLVLAGVFAVAGALKLPDPGESLRAVRAYRLLPESLVPAVGYGLPALEVVLAVVLLAGVATRLAAVVSAVLMAAFIVGVASAAARGLSIDCGCFGGGGEVGAGETRYTQEIVRDAALLAGALFLARWPRTPFSVDGWLAGTPTTSHDDDVDYPDDHAGDHADDDNDTTTRTVPQ